MEHYHACRCEDCLRRGKPPRAVKSACYAVEFDSHPQHVGRVALISSENNVALVVICDGVETVLIEATRDQWGVWLTVDGICVSQEDGTRSFLDGMIKAITEMRRLTECQTVAATAVSG